MSQIVPGRKPNCAASVGPTSGPGAGDRREVVAEEHPSVRRHEVAAVVEPLGRRRARGVELEHRVGDEPRVEAVGDEIGADRGDDEPRRADRLAARHARCTPNAAAPSDRDGHPHRAAQKSIHVSSQSPNPNAKSQRH